jgi:hypothetical protein
MLVVGMLVVDTFIEDRLAVDVLVECILVVDIFVVGILVDILMDKFVEDFEHSKQVD